MMKGLKRMRTEDILQSWPRWSLEKQTGPARMRLGGETVYPKAALLISPYFVPTQIIREKEEPLSFFFFTFVFLDLYSRLIKVVSLGPSNLKLKVFLINKGEEEITFVRSALPQVTAI